MNWQTATVILISVLVFAGVFHELAHCLVAIAYGNECHGIHLGWPYSYADIEGPEYSIKKPLIYLSGGMTDAGILALLYWISRKSPSIQLTMSERAWLYFCMIWSVVYAIWETITWMLFI